MADKDNQMTKTQAIKKFCFDCAGESNKEVTLCPAADCQLWPYRTGAKAGTKVYQGRMATAKKNYGQEFTDFENDLRSRGFSLSSSSKQRSVEKKNG